MRSIRLSLVVSFLALLAVTQAVVAVLVYRTNQNTLAEKNQTTRELLWALHESRKSEANEVFNRHLLERAARLAKRAQQQSTLNRWNGDLYPLAALNIVFNPPHVLLQPVWFSRGRNTNLLWPELMREAFVKIQIDEDAASDDDHGDGPNGTNPPHEYFQVYSVGGVAMQRSRSLPEDAFRLDSDQIAKLRSGVEWMYDDTVVAPGVPVRRVTMQTPVSRVRWAGFFRPPPRRDGGPNGQRPTPNPERGPRTMDSLQFIFQFARGTEALEESLAQSRHELNDKLSDLEEASEQTLASLRRSLLLIALCTFGATLIGGFWLVHVGLSPLRRVTEAVSRVSAKDFRLPLDAQHLPQELTPIVKRLSETLEQLRRAFEREKQAAADISHELRTPLSALLATTDVALRKDRTPEEYRSALTDCRASGRQMRELVERLLALARLDAGVDPLQRRDVEVTEVAEVCAAMIRPLAEAKGLQLRYHDAPPVSVRTDPDKLHEVLSNLLHNAIEYNQPNGSIDVRVARDNGSVVLEVADTGIGISPEQRERIFERFYRADPSRQADGLHAGLGLAITKSYVELMGGRISVESREGQGSTFRIELPAGANGASKTPQTVLH